MSDSSTGVSMEAFSSIDMCTHASVYALLFYEYAANTEDSLTNLPPSPTPRTRPCLVYVYAHQ